MRSETITKKVLVLAALIAASVAAATLAAQGTAPQGERWLHISVTHQDSNGEKVRVNVPFSLAESLLTAVKTDRLDHGKIKIRDVKIEEVDVRKVFEALKTAKDGEYVTVESASANVRVAKEKGFLIVKARDRSGKNATVDVRMPLEAVDALFSAGPDELNVVAALRVLAGRGDMELVTVKDSESTVRVWVDSKSAME